MHSNNPPSRLPNWLHGVPIQDPVNRQMASLLQIMLLGLIVIVILATLVNLSLPEITYPWQVIVFQGLLVSLIFAVPLVMLRRGYFRVSVFFLIALFLFLITTSIFRGNLRALAENLNFFTLAILLAGLLVGRRALIITFSISAGVVLLVAFREQNPVLQLDYITIAGNFILLNGLMSVFIASFGVTFRKTLTTALEREVELNSEIINRRQTEAALQQSTERLAILHEIDRALISAHSSREIAMGALGRIRRLLPSLRASVTLFDLNKREAYFLAADLDKPVELPDTPITFQEFGQRIIDELEQNRPWAVNDILKDPQATELDKRLAKESGIHTWLSLPLLYQGRLIGALNLGRGIGQPFTSADAETAQDVANQIAIAIQQTRLYEALQTELTERQALIAQLEANNAELERFTYTVSHDLRNPLVTIKGFLGMLGKDIQENRSDRIQSDLQRIAGAADKMDTLLTDLLELSRIGRIVNPPEEVDLVKLTQDALEMVDAYIRSKNVTVHISPDLPIIHGDRLRLREVLENLIANAAKYMGDQSDPVIEIGIRSDEGEPVIFVKDNGVGIESKYHIRIFNLFEKLNPTVEGTGIGLALIKRIIEVHGGKIWVESDGLGEGSTFCFTIPDARKITGGN